jgi:hypothetical protein
LQGASTATPPEAAALRSRVAREQSDEIPAATFLDDRAVTGGLLW